MGNKFRRVDLSRIPKEKRAETWERLQAEHPSHAAMLQEPFVVAMRQRFKGLRIMIDLPIGDDF